MCDSGVARALLGETRQQGHRRGDLASDDAQQATPGITKFKASLSTQEEELHDQVLSASLPAS